jgi:hypothetical protein
MVAAHERAEDDRGISGTSGKVYGVAALKAYAPLELKRIW